MRPLTFYKHGNTNDDGDDWVGPNPIPDNNENVPVIGN